MSIPFRIHEETGGVCCSTMNAAGTRFMPLHPCDKCKRHFAAIGLNASIHQEDITMENYDSPNPYEHDLAALRAAQATPATTFEERYKNMRLRELAAEDDEVAELRAAHEARLAAPEPQPRAAEVSEFDPPDPWAAGIKALQARDARARDAKESR